MRVRFPFPWEARDVEFIPAPEAPAREVTIDPVGIPEAATAGPRLDPNRGRRGAENAAATVFAEAQRQGNPTGLTLDSVRARVNQARATAHNKRAA